MPIKTDYVLNQFLWFSKDTHSTALRCDACQQHLDNTNLYVSRRKLIICDLCSFQQLLRNVYKPNSVSHSH